MMGSIILSSGWLFTQSLSKNLSEKKTAQAAKEGDEHDTKNSL